MNVYASRTDSEIHERLTEKLSLSGEEGLTECAIEADQPIDTGEDGDFTHSITIDYIGGSASVLLDLPGLLLDQCSFDELKNLLKHTGKLNKDGYFIKIRLLLLYPYSAAGQIRIQSEDSHMRSSINEPSPNLGQELRDPDWATIKGSHFLRRVERNLTILHELEAEVGEDHPIQSYPNMLEVRFTPVNTMMWGIRVNDIFFCQPYIYGKKDRHDFTSATHELPVIESHESDGIAYDLLLDHFRHLWEYDATIFGEDGVQQFPSATRVKPSNDITFLEKAKSQVSGKEGDTKKNIKQRSEELQARLDPHCPDLVTPPDEEIAFISSSWVHHLKNVSEPQPDAVTLEYLINEFFNERQDLDDVRDILPELIDTPPGERFTEKVYNGLESATLGIVLLTPEISSDDVPNPIASPNVYHELGYLMSNLEDNRTYVFTSENVEPPSNLQGMVHIPYDDMYHGFVDLLVALEETNLISEDEFQSVTEVYYSSLKDLEEVDDQTRAMVQNYIDNKVS